MTITYRDMNQYLNIPRISKYPFEGYFGNDQYQYWFYRLGLLKSSGVLILDDAITAHMMDKDKSFFYMPWQYVMSHDGPAIYLTVGDYDALQALILFRIILSRNEQF